MADSNHQQETRTEGIPATGFESQPETESAGQVTAEERGEVEQETNGTLEAGAAGVGETEVLENTNGSTVPEQSQEAQASRTYTLPIRNKESEHTEKTVSAVAEDPASLEAPGVTEQNNETIPDEHNTGEPATTSAEPAASNGDSTSTTTNAEPQPQANGTTPAKSPRVPAYLQSTSASASKSSPKPSPSRLPNAKTPLSTSKLNANLRSASNSKPPAQGSPAGAPARARSPVRTAHLAHLTAPTAASAARKDMPPPAQPAKPLGRATSVRSKKPVEGSHFLAPTASSVSRKDLPAAGSGSSLGRTASKRERPGTAAPPAARKVSSNSARTSLPPDAASTRPTATARVPSSGSQGKPAPTGSFLDRMTRPTAASSRKTHEKVDGVKSPQPAAGKTAGGLGRAASVRTKVNGAVDAAGKKFGGLRGKSGLSGAEKKRGIESDVEKRNGVKVRNIF